MASKFYYNLSNSVGEDAAKTASDSSVYATPSSRFTIHNYYVDANPNINPKDNYEYIAPYAKSCGGWASYDYHAIAQDKFYYASSSSAYTSFKFVHRLSAPLLRDKTRKAGDSSCQAPFLYSDILIDNAPLGIKIY